MTTDPFDHRTYDFQRQLEEYRSTATDGTYQGPNVEEGRVGPDGKTSSTEEEEPKQEQPTEPKEEPKKEEPKSMEKLQQVAQGAVTAPLGLIDFGMDVIGKIPGAAGLDNAWDEMTRFSNPNAQAARDMASVIVPSIAATVAAGPLGSKAAAAINGGKIAQGLATAGITAGSDVAIAGFSDYSERDEGLARGVDDFLEKIGRPLGLKVPDYIRILDDDSPELRKRKLMFEAGGLSIIGDALGYLMSAGKPIMRWFEPKDATAQQFKQIKIRENPDPDTVFRTQELDEEIMQLTDEIEAVDGVGVDDLIERRDLLLEEQGALFNAYFNTGRSKATADPLGSYVQEMEASRSWQTDEVAAKKLQENPNLDTFDPDVLSQLSEPASRPRQSIPRANIARNAADVAAIRSGTSEGVPTPLLTYPMLKEGLELDTTSRKIVTELVEDYAATGEYGAIVDGFRFTKKQMDDNALDLFTEIVQARDVNQLREALLPRKYTKMIDQQFGVNQLTDADIPSVGKAIKYLTKEFLGEDVAAMSARTIETTAKEIQVYADAMNVFRGQADEDAIMDTIIDKLTFLSEEYGVAKYSSGWSLRNFKWWERKPDTEQLAKQFTEFAKQNHESALAFNSELKRLKAEDPKTASTLMMAYDLTGGSVDSMSKLTAWTKQQLSPMGMLRAGKDGRNAFSEGLWGVLYNNVLSGLSAGRAAVGAISGLVIKPVDYMIGAGLRGAIGKDFDQLRKGMYAFSIERETISRALGYGWEQFRRASSDPETMIELMRKDTTAYTSSIKAKMEVLDRMEQELLKKNDLGSYAMLQWTKGNLQASMNPFMRFGTNLMLGVDAMGTYMNASMVSKFKAYDEAYTSGMKLDDLKLLEAQRKVFEQVFDPKTDLIKSSWVKQQSQELALNETSGLSESLGALIGKYPALQYAVMFPNTSLNVMRKVISYTPFSLLPNSNRYAKTLYAKSAADIDEVMVLHNLDVNDPDKLRIVDNLKNEYTGRIATGAMITAGLLQYGLAGNIRGNYPRDKKSRNALLSSPGWRPKTIKVGGNWYSYEGIIPLDPLLTVIGDMGYYASDISSPFKEDIVQKLMWTITQSFAGQTPMSGLEPIVAMLQGDDSAMMRFLTNTGRMAVPLSGAQGVISKAITNTSKEIYDDLQNYIGSRIPGVNLTVPDKYDWWTGMPVNEIDNPILRIMNAINPIPVTQTEEPWRVWINQSGLDLSTMLLKDSTGTHTYSAQERSLISKFIGEQQIWKEVYGNGKPSGKGIMFNQKYNDQLDIVRAELATGKTFDELSPNVKLLPVVRRLTGLVKEAQKLAEQKMFSLYPTIEQKVTGKRMADNAMKAGDPSKAYSIAEKTQQQLKTLEKFK